MDAPLVEPLLAVGDLISEKLLLGGVQFADCGKAFPNARADQFAVLVLVPGHQPVEIFPAEVPRLQDLQEGLRVNCGRGR